MTMPVPDFQTMMLPTLEALADQKPHRIRELGDFVAKALNISDDERRELGATQSRAARRVSARRLVKERRTLELPRGREAHSEHDGYQRCSELDE